MEKKPEARKAFQEFIDKYPTHPSVVSARAHLRELTAPGRTPGRAKKGSQ
jgi:hypothetical protein